MSELLLELFSEEIPARMQLQCAMQLQKQMADHLGAAQLSYNSIEYFTTPRRLALVVKGLPKVKTDSTEERKGPRVGAPEAALEGFLRSAGITKEQLEERDTPKGKFYFAVLAQKGGDVAETLVPLLEAVITGFTWPKSMRWNNYPLRWVRPLQRITCLFDGNILPISFGHIRAADIVQGHRFLSGEPFPVENFDDYRTKLKQHKVILAADERKRVILDQAHHAVEALGCTLKEDEGLLEEVAGLVELPVVLRGNIDESFMVLPSEVLSTSMRTHQRYFSVLDPQGKLAPYFLLVANIEPDDKGEQIIHGNERVLRARLSDAKFFWEQDRRFLLETRVEKLEHIVFHAKLGSVGDKVTRIQALAKFLAMWIPHANLVKVERAAMLAKADLVTEMVKEFPELQGIMGSYYAHAGNEEKEVAVAIREHYSPAGPHDTCPTHPVSVAVALADKIDTLVGLFIIGEKPTGSKDPYALRRATLGIIRIILEGKLRIPLKLLLNRSIDLYPRALLKGDKGLPSSERVKIKPEQLVAELLEFFADRLKVVLKDQSVRHDLISAVFDGGNEDDLMRLVMRAKALDAFIKTEDGINLLAAYKRATNIVRIEEKKDDTTYHKHPDKKLLIEDAEEALWRAMEKLKPELHNALEKDDFVQMMASVASLRKPVDTFFDTVTVNCGKEDVRVNRLLLLSQMRGFLDEVANFGMIESI